MRPIKFRTPSKCQNGHFRFYYWSATFGECFNRTWGPKDPECKCPTHAMGEGFEKCGPDEQFTGAYDMGGKEIFENDIVRCNNRLSYDDEIIQRMARKNYKADIIQATGRVAYDDQGYDYNIVDVEGRFMMAFGLKNSEYEVIGHIHEKENTL